jgi:hypothetical protein
MDMALFAEAWGAGTETKPLFQHEGDSTTLGNMQLDHLNQIFPTWLNVMGIHTLEV